MYKAIILFLYKLTHINGISNRRMQANTLDTEGAKNKENVKVVKCNKNVINQWTKVIKTKRRRVFLFDI